MRDELSHIRNREDEERKIILAEHQEYMDSLFVRHPQLKQNFDQVEQVRKQIISATLGKLRGEPLAGEISELEMRLAELMQKRNTLLGQYGINPASLEPKWNCPRCQDTGMVAIDGKYLACTCTQAKRRQLFLQRANLPVRIADATFASVKFDIFAAEHRSQAKRIYAYVKKFCDELKKNTSSSQGLFIHGPTGSGKSYLLGCIANYLAEQMSVRYMVYADFLDSLRATFNRDAEHSEQQLMAEVKNVDLLLLDDLGIEKPSEFSLKYLAQIIDYRYRNLKPVVVTSNFTLNELIERTKTDLYGERIVWRLGEICSNILKLQGNLRMIL
ncbi:MAG: ATP-binding protein [Eubacteriales bacterium]|nr:ATP-binding protein [Eubacteriales bacterium]